MITAMLLDLSPCCPHHQEEAVQDLFAKAMAPQPKDDSIWLPHSSPFIQQIIELFSQQGMAHLGALQVELARWINAEAYKGGTAAPPPGSITRWSPGELALVKHYLETKPPSAFTLDDWMLVVDYLVQKYLPPDVLLTEAEWLATRAGLMGKVQANLAQPPTLPQASAILAALPGTVAAAQSQFGLTGVEASVLSFGKANCADMVQAVSESVRHRLRRAIIDYQEAQFTGNRAVTAESLQTRLFDEFAEFNRDWRRIAVTEAGENANQGLVAAAGAGARLRRVEAYANACAFCRKIDGMEFDVVSPDAPDKDGWTQVWVGKTNYGRSAAPRKIVDGQLVPRPADERWWPAAGTQHPHCRGVWLVIQQPDDAGDPAFTAWIQKILSTHA